MNRPPLMNRNSRRRLREKLDAIKRGDFAPRSFMLAEPRLTGTLSPRYA